MSYKSRDNYPTGAEIKGQEVFFCHECNRWMNVGECSHDMDVVSLEEISEGLKRLNEEEGETNASVD
jgi:hypothetical protein